MLRPWQLEIQLDKKCGKALYLQIADAIINAIKSRSHYFDCNIVVIFKVY